MKIYPAIDLMGGRCVRLLQGRADAATVYSDDPVATALRWERVGGAMLHLVDLDGAFAGEPRHAAVARRIAEALRIPVEVGGGLRTDAHVEELLDAGVRRVILGSRALADPAALRRLADRFPGRIVAGIDARDGFVQVKGWVETTTTRATDLARRVADLGVAAVVYTDTATDGMLSGPNLPALAALCDAVPGLPVVASGGIAGVESIRALVALGRRNLDGAIVGKALYEGAASLPELVAEASSGAGRSPYADSAAPRFRTHLLRGPGEFLVTSPFGPRRHPVTGEEGVPHLGIDGALWDGHSLVETDICAWDDGTVAEALDSDGPAGTHVAIDHGGGLVTRYFHLERRSLRVAPGDRVRRGQPLGYMGRTGRATGEHLHFQMERDGVPVDPMPALLAAAGR